MKIWQFLLYPFSLIYGGITTIRNYLYDQGYKKSQSFPILSINVGNLTVGGTGKSPHIEFLIEHFKSSHKIATLSRGYGRQSKGFMIAPEVSSASEIGDEPFQFFLKYHPEVLVSVGEKRALAIPQIMAQAPQVNLLLLDDAFQHRPVQAWINILLSDYNRPFYKDLPFPAGMLREARIGAQRADLLIVSKCPQDLSKDEKKGIEKQLKKYLKESCPVFFSGIKYAPPKRALPETSNQPGPGFEKKTEVILFSGIARPELLQNYVKNTFTLKKNFVFGDHYLYQESDIQKITHSWQESESPNRVILTTEKDYARLVHTTFHSFLKDYPVYYLPIKVYFLESDQEFLNVLLKKMK